MAALDPVNVLVWTCVVIFAATGLTTFLGLLGVVTLGGLDGRHHHHYLRLLVKTLLVEIAVTGVAAFGQEVVQNEEVISGLEEQVRRQSEAIPDTIAPIALGDATSQPESASRPPFAIPLPGVSRLDSLEEMPSAAPGPVRPDRAPSERLTLRSPPTYARATEGPDTAVAVLVLPAGVRYVEHRVNVLDERGDARYDVRLNRSGARVESVELRLIAVPGSRVLLRGSRPSWIGAVLEVVVQGRGGRDD